MKVGDIIITRVRRALRMYTEIVYHLVENVSNTGIVVETLPINERSKLLYIDTEDRHKYRKVKIAHLVVSKDAYNRILHGDMDQVRHDISPKWMKAYTERSEVVHFYTMYGDHVYCVAEDWRAGINSGRQYIRVILGKVLL